MLSDKKFNPRKCPYKQLRSHRGKAMLLVRLCSRKEGENAYKVRVISFKRDLKNFSGFPTRCLYTHLSSPNEIAYSSCFQGYGTSYRVVIDKMENYDERLNHKIVHIDFYK